MGDESAREVRTTHPLLRQIVDAQIAIDAYQGEFGGQHLQADYEELMQKFLRLGVRVVEPCIAGLLSGESQVRSQAARTLQRLRVGDLFAMTASESPVSQRIIAALAQAVHDQDADVRHTAGTALLAWDRRRAIVAFVEALQDYPLSAVCRPDVATIRDIVQAALGQEEPRRRISLERLSREPSSSTARSIDKALAVLAPKFSRT